MPAHHVVAGLDVGASKTHLRAQHTDSSEQKDFRRRGANLQQVGLDEAAEEIAALVREAVRPHRPIDTLAVSAGVAGAGRADEQNALTDRLRTALVDEATTVQVEVVSDALIALEAAFGPESGLAVVAGTGSVVLARTTDGMHLRAGGWGSLLGDAGSGYAVGRAGLRAVAEALEGGRDTALRPRVRESFDITDRDDLIHRVYRDDLPLQDVAPLVIDAAEAGDTVASRLLAEQASELATQVGWALGRGKTISPRAALLGGLVQNDHYADILREALCEKLSGWSIEVLPHEPVVGALRRARRLLS